MPYFEMCMIWYVTNFRINVPANHNHVSSRVWYIQCKKGNTRERVRQKYKVNMSNSFEWLFERYTQANVDSFKDSLVFCMPQLLQFKQDFLHILSFFKGLKKHRCDLNAYLLLWCPSCLEFDCLFGCNNSTKDRGQGCEPTWEGSILEWK